MSNFEEYKLFLERVDKLSERRQAITTIYLTVNTAIMSIIAFIFKDITVLKSNTIYAVLVILIAGCFICELWRRLIDQYSKLLDWWYKQLRGMEQNILESSRLLTMEYEELYGKSKKQSLINLTMYEKRLVWLLMFIYVSFIFIIIYLSIYTLPLT